MNVKKDFPIFERKINEKEIIYLDSAATSQKPIDVIEAVSDFYERSNSNIHRGIYRLSEESTELYENARNKIAKFINAENEEVIFTKGTTESLNLIANCLSDLLDEGDVILLTEMEHHANLIPWQIIARKKNLKLKFIPVDENGNLLIDEKLFEDAKVVSVCHISNALGTINDVEKIEKLAHRRNAYFILDAAQSISHLEIDVKKINCDFMAFSGHKMFGPTGIGVFYGKKDLLNKLNPFLYGGDMIKEVSLNDAEWNDIPWKFEAGTQNISGAIGLGKAIDFISRIGLTNIENYEKELSEYLSKELSNIKDIKIYSPKKRSCIISFNLDEIHPHDIADLLGNEGICTRAGHHCCMPLMKKLNINGTLRISLSIYNSKKDIDKLVEILKKINERLK